MSHTVSATVSFGLLVTKTVTPGPTAVPDFTITEKTGQQTSATYDGSTTIPISESYVKDITLTAGTATLDLTALDQGSELPSLNLTGKKLKFIKVVADSANTQDVIVAKGATNGYAAFLGTNQLELAAGEAAMFGRATSMAAVDGTHKTIDITSAMAAAKCSVQLVFGS